MFTDGRFLPAASATRRLSVLALAMVAWAIVIFARLISLQVVQHEKYANIAKSQQEEKVDLPAPRGSILDRNGQPLAISVPVTSVSVDPRQIANIRLASEVLSDTLNLDQDSLYERLNAAREGHRGFLWVKRRIDPFETDRLQAMHLDWVTFKPESRRRYPGGAVGSHVVGAVYQDERGTGGVEQALESDLEGKVGKATEEIDVRREAHGSRVDQRPLAGKSITLTIDSRLQYIAERELKAGVEAKHARSGTAIVMNPYTGEILALANYPNYDPNLPPVAGEDPISRFNLGASVPFEPGSVFKVVTLAAALETTNLTPDSMIPTGNGVLKLPGRIVHESHGGYGTISMADVLAKSSNIGAILIGNRVGRENMYEYASRMGFGRKTGVPLPAESSGKLRPLTKWGATSLASVSMGQEVSVTSLQLARLGAVIANGGMLVKPRLVLKRDNTAEPVEPAERVLRPETAITMRRMMEGVVLRGTGRLHARLNGYTSGGKTGTAQIYDYENKRYSHNYNASFLGFAPVTNPALVVLVTVHRTSGESGQGADAAAPVFSAIMTEALRMFDVPRDIPDDQIAARSPERLKPGDLHGEVAIADAAGSSILEDEDDPAVRQVLLAQLRPASPAGSLDLAGGAARVLPSSKVVDVAPAPMEAEMQQVAVPVSANVSSLSVSEGAVPDFRGKTMRAVLEESLEKGFEVTVEGSGVARAQLPLPGGRLLQGQRIRVIFAR